MDNKILVKQYQFTNSDSEKEKEYSTSSLQDYTKPKMVQEYTIKSSSVCLETNEHSNTPQDLGRNKGLAIAEQERSQYIKNWIPKLVQKLQFYSYDEESEAFFWPIIDKISSVSTSIMSEILSKITIDYYDCPNILCAVATILCSFDLEEVENIGPTIMMALLSNKNETVKEYAVILLDNWESPSLLPLFKHFDCSSPWLKSYLKRVIDDLER